jgi:putative membrane protein
VSAPEGRAPHGLAPEGRAPHGLAPERTALAWRRTALSLAAVSVGFGRLAAERWGLGATLVGLAGGLISIAILVVDGGGPATLEEVRRGDGRRVAALAALSLVLAIGALIFVLGA